MHPILDCADRACSHHRMYRLGRSHAHVSGGSSGVPDCIEGNAPMLRMWPIRIVASAVAFCAALPIAVESAHACSRFVYLGQDGKIFTARSMDWARPIQTSLYILPRGMERNGEVGPNSIRWTSKYGSLVATAFDGRDGVRQFHLRRRERTGAERQYSLARRIAVPRLRRHRPARTRSVGVGAIRSRQLRDGR